MGRRGSIWSRKGRPGWFATIQGKQVFLALDKREAERVYHLHKLNRAPKRPAEHSMHDMIVLYLQWFGSRVAKGECSVKTLKCYRVSLTFWEREYHALKPEDMRAYHVTAWLAKNPQWNPTSAHDRVRHVRIFCEWLAGEGFIEDNRLRRAKSPTPLKRQATAPGNLEAMDRAITDERFKDFFVVLYDTGARPGEIATLEASRIDLSLSVAVVNGKTGERLIGLTLRVVAILREAAQRCPHGPVLLTARGNPWNENTWSRCWQKWARIAGCVGECVAYSCRHDLDRRWHAAGIDSITISKQMGHSLRGQPSLKLIASTYGHRGADVLSAAARQASLPNKRSKRG